MHLICDMYYVYGAIDFRQICQLNRLKQNDGNKRNELFEYDDGDETSNIDTAAMMRSRTKTTTIVDKMCANGRKSGRMSECESALHFFRKSGNQAGKRSNLMFAKKKRKKKHCR